MLSANFRSQDYLTEEAFNAPTENLYNLNKQYVNFRSKYYLTEEAFNASTEKLYKYLNDKVSPSGENRRGRIMKQEPSFDRD